MGRDSGEDGQIPASNLDDWRQGDCVIGEQWFTYRFDPQNPITDEAQLQARDDATNSIDNDMTDSEVSGFMVVSQTCDIVRSWDKRPFLDVCPLVEADEDGMKDAMQGSCRRFAIVKGLEGTGFVADLDRVMTVEKAVALAWARTPGCSSDEERRKLAEAIANKFSRFAFPDDFHTIVRKLRDRIVDKAGKVSDEGLAVDGLREIRVTAAPSWDADQVKLTFWFIRKDEIPAFQKKGWDHWKSVWENLLVPAGRFVEISVLIQTLRQPTAKDYVESDRLDLGYLSGSD